MDEILVKWMMSVGLGIQLLEKRRRIECDTSELKDLVRRIRKDEHQKTIAGLGDMDLLNAPLKQNIFKKIYKNAPD